MGVDAVKGSHLTPALSPLKGGEGDEQRGGATVPAPSPRRVSGGEKAGDEVWLKNS